MVVSYAWFSYNIGEVMKMKFEENLRELRKQMGYSQEELAEKLQVSRQAVSKWENGSGYPELDKLMSLCELFHCTMDDLLKGDVSEHNVVSVERYEAHYRDRTRAITFGVFMVMSAITAGGFLDGYLAGNQDVVMGTVFFVFITIGVLTFVYNGMQVDDYKKKFPTVPQHIYAQDEIDEFEKKYRLSTVFGIGLIFIDLIIIMLIETYVPEHISGSLFMFIMSIAVANFVYFGTQKDKYDGTYKTVNPDKKKRDTLMGKSYGVIMLLATIVFFVWSFAFHGWELSWLAFVVGSLGCGIVSIIFGKED